MSLYEALNVGLQQPVGSYRSEESFSIMELNTMPTNLEMFGEKAQTSSDEWFDIEILTMHDLIQRPSRMSIKSSSVEQSMIISN